MKRTLVLLVASALALAAAAKVQVSAVFPPKALPQGTALVLEDAQGQALWQTGQGALPKADDLNKAAYVAFQLPGGKAYVYAVAKKARSLEALVVRVGKRTYTLGALLKNRNAALGKDGSLVVRAAAHTATHTMTHQAQPAPVKKP